MAEASGTAPQRPPRLQPWNVIFFGAPLALWAALGPSTALRNLAWLTLVGMGLGSLVSTVLLPAFFGYRLRKQLRQALDRPASTDKVWVRLRPRFSEFTAHGVAVHEPDCGLLLKMDWLMVRFETQCLLPGKRVRRLQELRISGMTVFIDRRKKGDDTSGMASNFGLIGRRGAMSRHNSSSGRPATGHDRFDDIVFGVLRRALGEGFVARYHNYAAEVVMALRSVAEVFGDLLKRYVIEELALQDFRVELTHRAWADILSGEDDLLDASGSGSSHGRGRASSSRKNSEAADGSSRKSASRSREPSNHNSSAGRGRGGIAVCVSTTLDGQKDLACGPEGLTALDIGTRLMRRVAAELADHLAKVARRQLLDKEVIAAAVMRTVGATSDGGGGSASEGEGGAAAAQSDSPLIDLVEHGVRKMANKQGVREVLAVLRQALFDAVAATTSGNLSPAARAENKTLDKKSREARHAEALAKSLVQLVRDKDPYEALKILRAVKVSSLLNALVSDTEFGAFLEHHRVDVPQLLASVEGLTGGDLLDELVGKITSEMSDTMPETAALLARVTSADRPRRSMRRSVSQGDGSGGDDDNDTLLDSMAKLGTQFAETFAKAITVDDARAFSGLLAVFHAMRKRHRGKRSGDAAGAGPPAWLAQGLDVKKELEAIKGDPHVSPAVKEALTEAASKLNGDLYLDIYVALGLLEWGVGGLLRALPIFLPVAKSTIDKKGYTLTVSNFSLSGVRIDAESLKLTLLGASLPPNGAFAITAFGVARVKRYVRRSHCLQLDLLDWPLRNHDNASGSDESRDDAVKDPVYAQAYCRPTAVQLISDVEAAAASPAAAAILSAQGMETLPKLQALARRWSKASSHGASAAAGGDGNRGDSSGRSVSRHSSQQSAHQVDSAAGVFAAVHRTHSDLSEADRLTVAVGEKRFASAGRSSRSSSAAGSDPTRAVAPLHHRHTRKASTASESDASALLAAPWLVSRGSTASAGAAPRVGRHPTGARSIDLGSTQPLGGSKGANSGDRRPPRVSSARSAPAAPAATSTGLPPSRRESIGSMLAGLADAVEPEGSDSDTLDEGSQGYHNNTAGAAEGAVDAQAPERDLLMEPAAGGCVLESGYSSDRSASTSRSGRSRRGTSRSGCGGASASGDRGDSFVCVELSSVAGKVPHVRWAYVQKTFPRVEDAGEVTVDFSGLSVSLALGPVRLGPRQHGRRARRMRRRQTQQQQDKEEKKPRRPRSVPAQERTRMDGGGGGSVGRDGDRAGSGSGRAEKARDDSTAAFCERSEPALPGLHLSASAGSGGSKQRRRSLSVGSGGSGGGGSGGSGGSGSDSEGEGGSVETDAGSDEDDDVFDALGVSDAKERQKRRRAAGEGHVVGGDGLLFSLRPTGLGISTCVVRVESAVAEVEGSKRDGFYNFVASTFGDVMRQLITEKIAEAVREELEEALCLLNDRLYAGWRVISRETRRACSRLVIAVDGIPQLQPQAAGLLKLVPPDPYVSVQLLRSGRVVAWRTTAVLRPDKRRKGKGKGGDVESKGDGSSGAPRWLGQAAQLVFVLAPTVPVATLQLRMQVWDRRMLRKDELLGTSAPRAVADCSAAVDGHVEARAGPSVVWELGDSAGAVLVGCRLERPRLRGIDIKI